MKELDPQFFDPKLYAEYCSGLFSDEMDKMGYRDQVVNSWKLNNSKARMFGRVRTLKIETFETPDERIHIGLSFLAGLKCGDVLLVKGNEKFAYFGELMSRMSVDLGLAGAVIDGLTRDSHYTNGINFPIFSKGYTPKDIKGRGRVDCVDVGVEVGGCMIQSGDYVFGDSDALVFIPAGLLSNLMVKVNAAALEEFEIKQKISQGYTVTEILKDHEAF